MRLFPGITFSVLLLCISSLHPQAKYLQSGPLVGYSEMMEVMLWVQTNAPASVKINYFEKGTTTPAWWTNDVHTEKATAFTAKLIADQVVPGKIYEYKLYINGKEVRRNYPLKFQTQKLWQWREDPPPFSFAIGSCAYVNDPPYDRPGKPYGANYEIFTSIYEKHPDFMVWMGDNVYMREVDWYSRTGIFYRYTHTRSLPELQPLWGSVHHYATWDDHDFGPNNSDRSFRQKQTTLEAFKLFWPNPTFGTEDFSGVATMFQWADVDFFLLDNRFHRSPDFRTTGERTILGKAQIQWLIDGLKTSRAPFKFVVMGGQFLNNVDRFENYSIMPAEREQILNTISQERIPGVMFFSSDRHHTKLSKKSRYNDYPIYDLTISPFTAGPNPRAANEKNLYREDSTFYGDRNFAILNVSGPRNERVLKITVYNVAGEEVWNREILAKDLR